MGYSFDTDTAVTRAGDGVHHATLTERWNSLSGPNGGYLLATCVRALTEAMPHPHPLVVSGSFLRRPADPGPARVETEVLHSGRRLSTGSAALVQDGNVLLHTTATFTDLDQAEGRSLELGAAPGLPAPEHCQDPLNGGSMPGLSITDQIEYRFARVPGWIGGKPDGDPDAEFWMRFRDGRDPDLVALPFLVDAAGPAVLDLGEGSITVQLTVHLRARPAPGWLACRTSTRHLGSGFHEEDFEIWDSTGILVAQSRQLALLR